MACRVNYDPIQLVLVGDSTVGKTSICVRWKHDQILADYDPTLEDVIDGTVSIDREGVFPVKVIDTPGNEDFAAIRDSYLHNCDGIVFVYDVTRAASLEKIMSTYWPASQQTRREDAVPCILVGNKTDCPDDERQVTPRDGQEAAAAMKTNLVELSTRDSDGHAKTVEVLTRVTVIARKARTPRPEMPLQTSCKGCRGRCGCTLY